MDGKKVQVIEGVGQRKGFSLKKPEPINALTFFLCVFSVGVLIIYFCTAGIWDLDSDLAVQINLAAEIRRTGELLPSLWNYASDIWVFSTHLLIAPLKSFMDYITAMRISVFVFMLLSFGSILYFTNKTFKNKSGYLLFTCLLMCTSPTFREIVFYGSGPYCAVMMFIFLGFALFTGAVDEKFKVTSKSKLFGLVLLIVFMNLEGVRLVQAFGVPLMGAIVIYYFLSERENEEKSRLFKDIIKILLILGGAEAAGVLGFMILNSLLRNNNTSSSFYFINSTEFFDNFKNFITSWGDIIGISVMERVTTGYVTASAKLISPRGLLTLIKIMLNICLLLILPAIQIKNYKKQPFGIKLFIIFTVIHITETVVLFLFTTSGSLPINRYWFSSTWLLYGLSCTYVYELYQKAGDKPLKAVIAAGMIAAVLPGAWEMGSLVKMYYSEPSSQRDVFAYDVERLERLCEHLEDKGLSYGYSTYWNAGVISALSNRQILVNGISVLDKICPSEHLVSSYYYNEEAFSGSTFLLLTADENQKFTNSRNYGLYGQPLYIDQVENFYVYVYDYNIAKNDFSGNVNFSGPFASDLSITFSEVSENGYYLTDGTEGYCMFGPNARTEPGTYRFTLNYSVIESADSEAAGNFDVSVNAGSEILGSSQIYINSDSITLDVTFSGDETFEYKIWNYSGSVIEIQSVEMEKIS